MFVPTHAQGNILDVLLVNKPENILDHSGLGYLGGSDHQVISIDIHFGADITKSEEKVPDWNNANKDGLNTFFAGVQWQKILNNGTTEQAWDSFHQVINDGMSLFVPLKARRNPASPHGLLNE